MDEWHIGDPIDWGDGWMDAQNWGRGGDDEDKDNRDPPKRQSSHPSRAEILGRNAWDLYMKFKDNEALAAINDALSVNSNHANNWNIKAIILEGLERFGESKECYDRSLSIKRNNTVTDNKARMIYKWSKELYQDDRNMERGLALLSEAIREISKIDSEEDIKKYRNQRDLFEKRIKELEYQKRALNIYKNNTLITITGTRFCKPSKFARGMILTLKWEPKNEYDSNAIAIYDKTRKVGYVANSDLTIADITVSASDLKNIPDSLKTKFLFEYKRKYYVAAIIDNI